MSVCAFEARRPKCRQAYPEIGGFSPTLLGTAYPRRERKKVEQGLVDHIQRFLLELRIGIAFVGVAGRGLLRDGTGCSFSNEAKNNRDEAQAHRPPVASRPAVSQPPRRTGRSGRSERGTAAPDRIQTTALLERVSEIAPERRSAGCGSIEALRHLWADSQPGAPAACRVHVLAFEVCARRCAPL